MVYLLPLTYQLSGQRKKMLSMAIIERQSLLSRKISAADSREQIFDAIKRVCLEFGFSHATLMYIPAAHDTLISPLIVETTIPAEFVREYDKSRFLPFCPGVRLAASSVVPQCWALDETIMPEAMLRMLREAGIVSGVIIPVTSVSGERFAIRFDGNILSPGQVVLNELAMIALHAFDVYDRLCRSEVPGMTKPLTRRELEVIRWTAQGKTSIEIGQILSLSDHTINAYMNNAIRKLDCVNRTQLVAKAIRMKLIT